MNFKAIQFHQFAKFPTKFYCIMKRCLTFICFCIDIGIAPNKTVAQFFITYKNIKIVLLMVRNHSFRTQELLRQLTWSRSIVKWRFAIIITIINTSTSLDEELSQWLIITWRNIFRENWCDSTISVIDLFIFTTRTCNEK